MHPNRKFHVEDQEAMARFVREAGFGLVAVQTEAGLRAVHVPLLVEGERLRFHVSRGNAVHAALLEGGEALAVVNGPHAYISPDWYGLEGRVPTWNYVAVELNGPVRPLDGDALVRLLDAMSAEHEGRLEPKPAWTRDKMGPGRFEALLKAIGGFEMEIAAWRGTAKIDQDKPPEVRERIAQALDGRGEAGMAALMRPGSSGIDHV
ncbi:MAG TPA: FMN-binding negative transcriptional regulator [Allosphingosinicella sp.]|jgi:transcriptional regulator